MPFVLTIAGSDPTGGAGIQRDLETLAALGAQGCAVVTAVTAQNAQGVGAIHEVPTEIIAAQLEAVFEEFDVHAIKTGMLPSAASVEIIVERLARLPRVPLIVDPVIRASTGRALADDGAVDAMRSALFPRALLVTPNLDEASRFAGMTIASLDDMREAARRIAHDAGCAVLVTGGHAAFAPATDVLYDGAYHEFRAATVAPIDMHGTGCTLTAAIAAGIAATQSLCEAIATAKEHVSRVMQNAARAR